MRPMQLLIPFAAPRAAPWGQLSGLRLPHLKNLLARWTETRRDEADELSLSPPHERALALALGWQGADGRLPWAAQAAAADGIDVGDLAWGLLTPSHWHLGTEQVSLIDPAGLMLDAATSKALFAAVQELFTSQGWLLAWGAPLRWYAAHESLAELPCASLDRVIGRNVDRWLGHDPGLRTLRRLQSEVQMLLYGHPLNEAREAQGLLPVNSFWLSGCGMGQPATGVAPQVDDRLRAPALAGDWAGWAQAWETLDEGPIRALLAEPQVRAALTLCGDRTAWRLEPASAGWLARTAQRLRARPSVLQSLEAL
jgi:hypothetical protein